jgi:hypothetical protein
MANTQWLSCSCGHVGYWHRGRCRVTNCACPGFARAAGFTAVHSLASDKGHGPRLRSHNERKRLGP